ncbi:MAG TPA: primary-amine oxidase [Opitutaceae bacterium]|jgi:primary-amine oxidase
MQKSASKTRRATKGGPKPLGRSGHPLDPLAPEEIRAAVALIKRSGKAGPKTRFIVVALLEPPKKAVLAHRPGKAWDRQASLVLLDNADGATYEAVVSLSRGRILRWTCVPGVQPSITLDEFFECEEALARDPAFQAALRRRGVTDFSLIMVDPWSQGNYGLPDDGVGMRLTRALTWVRSEPGDNGYARPIESLVAIVDLNRMQVVRIEDGGVVPLPPEAGNYSRKYIKDYRRDIRPLSIRQPEGPSFRVEGNLIRWQKWSLRIGFTAREGLVLHQVAYDDAGRVRPIIYRASLCDMVVPYGDPDPAHFRKNAFDCGEFGIGLFANSLALGCDCLGEIRYFDAHLATSHGEVYTIRNAICLHEEDAGILWKHMDWRTNESEVRRSRRLVVSFIATVGNYEYGFYWYFQQDGQIQFEVKLTGIMHTVALHPGEKRPYGRMVAPQVYAPIHQHMFNVRLDMMVDGLRNSIFESHNETEPPGPDNPHGNACRPKATLLRTEREAQQLVDPLVGRSWRISSSTARNRLGEPTSYRLVPGENIRCFLRDDATVMRRASFMGRHLWVTPYAPEERYATGDYPNQHPGGAGLSAYTARNRSIEDTNLVVWYTMGANHVPRPEDWPVMPVVHIAFMLKPDGFFERNPALDVPPSPHGDADPKPKR